jgi:hypothetical protein
MTISAVIYYYAGPLVTSPALGSASPVVTKIAFGFAIPTIIIAGVVNGSVACKYIYIRMWKGTNVVHQKTWKSMISWYGICALFWVVAWILAESIPNFNLLLGLIAALFGSWFSCKFGTVSTTTIRLTYPRCTSYGYVVLPAQGALAREQAHGYVDTPECFSLLHRCRNCEYYLGTALWPTLWLTSPQFCLGMWSSGEKMHNGSGGKVFACANNWSPVSAAFGQEQ